MSIPGGDHSAVQPPRGDAHGHSIAFRCGCTVSREVAGRHGGDQHDRPIIAP